jgi:hypothetical protein
MNPSQRAEWAEAQRRCPLTEEAVAMARELGISPRSLIKNIPSKSQRWKEPVEDWVRSLHAKRFGERRSKPTTPPPARNLFACVAAERDFVQRIVLFGSVAAPLKKEVPRITSSSLIPGHSLCCWRSIRPNSNSGVST